MAGKSVKSENRHLFVKSENRHLFFDPELGRFTQPDTIIPDLGNPQSYNRYAYCLNNPLKYVDPDGHGPKEALNATVDFGGEALVGFFGEVGLGLSVGGPGSDAGYYGRQFGRNAGGVVSGYLTLQGAADAGTGLGIMALTAGAETVTLGGATVAAAPAAAIGAVQTAKGAAEGTAGLWGLHNFAKLTPLQKPKANASGGNQNPPNKPQKFANDNIRRITHEKHHINSESPEPKNVDDLYNKAVLWKEKGTGWAKDADGVIHRFSKPSNGVTHWNGSTAGPKPIEQQNLPPREVLKPLD